MATLPIENYKANIAASVVENTVTLVQGETGSGKTTQVPQYLYKLLPKYRNKFIGVTQPRRVAAMTLAQRVAEEMDSKLGGLVGYRVRFEERLSEKTKIKFVTDGMLLREAIIDPDLSKYGIVVVDEAHERSVASDVLLSLLKDIAKRRKGFRIVVMSATLDVPKFQSYFKEVQQIKNSNIIKVEGRTFAIEILNTKEPQQDHLGCCLRGVIQILLFEPIGDILVFLTGQEEIEEAAQALRETLQKMDHSMLMHTKSEEGDKVIQIEKSSDLFRICPLYANMPPSEQAKAFVKYPNQRKIVLATNIAETSVTIPGIKYVVDSGLQKLKTFQAVSGVECLQLLPISKNSAMQRAGRAGRETAGGKCFRVYPTLTYANFVDNTEPEILRCNLAGTVLTLKAMGIENITSLDFIDKPRQSAMMAAFKTLIALGAIDAVTATLTKLGKEMSTFPTEPIYQKLLVTSLKAEYFPIRRHIASLVAMLSVENVFFNADERANQRRTLLMDRRSDHVSLIALLFRFEQVGRSEGKQFCRTNGLNDRSIAKALAVRQQLLDYMTQILQKRGSTIKQEKAENVSELLLKCMVEGLPLNIAKKTESSGLQAYSTKSGQVVHIHPSSILHPSQRRLLKTDKSSYDKALNPEMDCRCVLYSEVVQTSRTYIRWISDVTTTIN